MFFLFFCFKCYEISNIRWTYLMLCLHTSGQFNSSIKPEKIFQFQQENISILAKLGRNLTNLMFTIFHITFCAEYIPSLVIKGLRTSTLCIYIFVLWLDEKLSFLRNGNGIYFLLQIYIQLCVTVIHLSNYKN